jgi:hypothetical protein
MWLLDVNMPKQVRGLLGEFGIVAHAADDRGWGGLTNGALVEAIPQLRAPEFLGQFRDAWNRGPIRPAAGQLLHWPAD